MNPRTGMLPLATIATGTSAQLIAEGTNISETQALIAAVDEHRPILDEIQVLREQHNINYYSRWCKNMVINGQRARQIYQALPRLRQRHPDLLNQPHPVIEGLVDGAHYMIEWERDTAWLLIFYSPKTGLGKPSPLLDKGAVIDGKGELTCYHPPENWLSQPENP